MAFQYKYLRFTKQAGTGFQDVTGVGFTGKALLIWTTGQTAAGAATAAQLAIGITDGATQAVRFIQLPNGETATTSAQCEQTGLIAWKANATSGATPTATVQGAFSAWLADGFRINWTTNDGAADIYHVLVLGGSISAKLTHVDLSAGPGSTQAVTGVGFTPTSFIVLGGAATPSTSAIYSLGAPFGSMHGLGFSNVSETGCGWTLGRGTGTDADCYRGQHTDRTASIRTANLSGAGELMGYHISSADADGFTISVDAGGTECFQHILCLHGVRAKIGVFTAPAVTGNYTLTLPFQPSSLILQTLGRSISPNAADLGLSIGAWDGASLGSGGSWIGGVDASNPSVYRRSHYESKILETRNASSGAAELQATVSSVTSSSAVLNFSSVTGNGESILYCALAPSAAITGSAVFGVNTKVTATRAIAMGLDGNTNVLSEAGKLKVFGNLEVTGDLTVDGSTVLLGLAALKAAILGSVVTSGGNVVVDSDGNVVYTS